MDATSPARPMHGTERSQPSLPCLPDYGGGSILNLVQTVAEACGRSATGGAPAYSPLPDLPAEDLARATNLIVLVVDGLGYDYLTGAGAKTTLHRSLCRRLTSVFPSTTASAVTTYLTGLPPRQHGLTGWHMYFEEADAVAAVLPLLVRQGEPAPPAMLLPRLLFRHASFFDTIDRPSWVVSPASIVDSGFNRYHCGRATRVGFASLAQMFEITAGIVRGDPRRKYIHVYYPEIDTLSHAHGVSSEKVAAHLAALDEAFASFLADVAGTDTLVLVSADHGFIDAPPERAVTLDDHPQLAQLLRQPLCGEHRVAYCYLRPGMEAAFEDYVRSRLAHCADLYRSEELVARGWFGPGAGHPRLLARIGDYTLVMREDWTLKDWLPGERRYTLLGVHGGVSAEEMYVPLILAQA
jgi:hypothetical protein